MFKNSRRRFLGTAGAAALAIPKPSQAADAPLDAALKFKLGLVTYNLAAKWDLPTLLKACQAAKVAAIEFRTTHPHGVEPGLAATQRADVKKKCADAGVTIWGCGTVCEFHSPEARVVNQNVETCKQFVGLVAGIGGRGVKVRPNGLPQGVPVEKSLDQIGKALAACGKAAADAGVEIWVEVHGGGTQLPANMKKIMEACGHPSVGVTWNSNKAEVVNGSIKASFELLQPWIRSCHINELYKDSNGEYPYGELFRLLRSSGYDRYTLCEVGRTPATVEDGIEMLKYYRALWLELAGN